MADRPRTQGWAGGQQSAPAAKYQHVDVLGIGTASWKKERDEFWSLMCLRMRDTIGNEHKGDVRVAQRVSGGCTKSC